jgi:hypothetical protein
MTEETKTKIKCRPKAWHEDPYRHTCGGRNRGWKRDRGLARKRARKSSPEESAAGLAIVLLFILVEFIIYHFLGWEGVEFSFTIIGAIITLIVTIAVILVIAWFLIVLGFLLYLIITDRDDIQQESPVKINTEYGSK